ncbi:MAG: glycine zipper 2TM domain-containing protein [Pseudohongiellaceae bacterium]
MSGAVFAETSYEYAPVVESRPLYQVVEVSTPQEQCWEEEIAVDYSRQRQRSSTPVIVSTILGGAIGNAVGHNKSNKRVGAVLGAVLGHSIGRDIVRSNSRSGARGFEIVQRCETVYEQQQQERLIGYQVTYLYNGQERSIRTDTDPGDQIRLRVNVQPVL